MEAWGPRASQKPQMSNLFLQEWSIYSVTDHNHVIQGLLLLIHAAEWRFHPLIVRNDKKID